MYVLFMATLPLQHMGLRPMTGKAHTISPHIQCIYTICNRKAESLKLFVLSYVHVYFCINPVPIMACKILVEVQANYKLCAKTAVPAF